MSDEPQWITIREAALALGTSELTIRRRIKSGRISSRLEAGKYYVRLGEEPLEPPAVSAPETHPEEREPRESRPPAPSGRETRPAALEPVAPSESSTSSFDLTAFVADHQRLAESAGRAALLEEQLRTLEERYTALQDGALALSNRNGWLESKLEEREREIKLLTDSQHRVSWFRRIFLGG